MRICPFLKVVEEAQRRGFLFMHPSFGLFPSLSWLLIDSQMSMPPNSTGLEWNRKPYSSGSRFGLLRADPTTGCMNKNAAG